MLEEISAHFEVIAVRGNMDFGPEMEGLPRRRVVRIGSLDVGLRHGDGSPNGIEERILAEFGAPPPDLIVYGHTHRAADRLVGGVRFVNPGSPVHGRSESGGSVGRLTVTGTRARFEIIRI